ncbi:MAG TPA: hypothetical protein VGK88_01385, partial [bacterium]
MRGPALRDAALADDGDSSPPRRSAALHQPPGGYAQRLGRTRGHGGGRVGRPPSGDWRAATISQAVKQRIAAPMSRSAEETV